MEKTIKIICGIDVPVETLFNKDRFNVYKNTDGLYTLEAKEMPDGFNQEDPH